jgi:hypothetical protein
MTQYTKRHSAPIGPKGRLFRGELPPAEAGIVAKANRAHEIEHGDAIADFQVGNIMSNLKLILPAALVLGGFLVCSTVSYAKPDYTKQTKKACTYCHVDAQKKPKELKEAGKYYQEHKNLDGYTEKK